MARQDPAYGCVGTCSTCGCKIDGVGSIAYKKDNYGKLYHENCPKCAMCGKVLSGQCYGGSGQTNICLKCGGAKKKMGKPSYSTLSRHRGNSYGCGCGFKNQCAIKMSQALIKCDYGWKQVFAKSGKNICKCGYIRGAQDLANVIQSQWGGRDYGWNNPGSRPGSVYGKKGVIIYMDIKNYGGQGHIDRYPDGAEYWNCRTAWLWQLY